MSRAQTPLERTRQKSKKQTPLTDTDIKRLRTSTITDLRRQAAEQRERSLAEASEVLLRAEQSKKEPSPATNLGIISTRIAKESTTPVLASLAIDVPIRVWINNQQAPQAVTDYTSIDVSMPEADFENVIDPDDLAPLLGVTKGLIYHEAGHILYSLTFEELFEAARDQGCPIPRGIANALEPNMNDEIIDETAVYRWVHNVFEDQRMECALVRLSPVLENHLRLTALHMIVAPAAKTGRTSACWPLLCGRTYLSKDLLSRMRRLAYEEAQAAGLAREFRVVEDAVRKYKRATTERQLFEAVCQGVRGLRYWFTPHERKTIPDVDAHRKTRPMTSSPIRPLRDSATTDDTPPINESTEPGDNEGVDSPDPGSGSAPSAQSSGPVDDKDSIRDLVAEALATELTETYDRNEVTRVLRELGGATDHRLRLDPTIRDMTPDESVRAHEVKAGILDVLAQLYAQADPYWQFRREDGVLDPLTYQLREPGDTDYWIAQSGDTSDGRSLALSLVLDVSYSMSEKMSELSIAAVGIRLTCDELKIPCTVTTFADSANLLFDPKEGTREIAVRAHGGTYPREALEDLRYQHEGKQQHLVIVFTDGGWEGTPSMDQFRHARMWTVGVALDEWSLQGLQTRRFDCVTEIGDITTLPRMVTDSLSHLRP